MPELTINDIQDTFPASWVKPAPNSGAAINSIQDTFPTSWRVKPAPTAPAAALSAPPPTSTPTGRPTVSPDVSYLARTAFGEGEGEGLEGQRAIMHVIASRLGKRPSWGNVQKVVQAPNQFESWAQGNPRRPVMEGLDLNDSKVAQLVQLARAVLSGKDPDNTGGANLFWNPDKVNPGWAQKVRPTIKIGQHQFASE